MTSGKLAAAGALDLDIQGVTSDSRAVRPGYLFAALPGSAADGRHFIPDAVARGAVAVLTTTEVDAPAGDGGVCVILDANPRHRLAQIAARFFAEQPDLIVAVTGTNGKTSVTEFVRQLWSWQGRLAASYGTLGIITEEGEVGSGLTTPDPVELHRTLRELARNRINRVAMEASSHGLHQCRLDGVRLRAAAFTNLTQDHLDYHQSMKAYLAAKLRLFSELLASDGAAVLNSDASHSPKIAKACRSRGIAVSSFGFTDRADLRIASVDPTPSGQCVKFIMNGRRSQVYLPLVGAFQAMNALAALALVACVENEDPNDLLPGLGQLKGVSGRLQHVGNLDHGAAVYVDYAHTPDALRTVLSALRPHVASRLICVFGAGGDRDSDKRAPMGAAVADGADIAIVTDDNPRTENPAEIRQAVVNGCPFAYEIGDRQAAIHAGLDVLDAGDVLLIAGKGHESGQAVGNTIIPFDDMKVASAAILHRGGTVR
ncbi:MAG: UDP-N-acetylmuramoyl-L-alanyl-D-glutamate--2,6-diaminopimelate ligase [Rhodospirillaceae bacterium]|nr:UDP-N-acetylmuramoyl-L-alanyl-D-glutamate--2,6-diaminopimelate ligase [Rhodospirillaceae bacterium]